MKTVNEVAEKLLAKMYPDCDASARYAKLNECKQRVASSWPVARVAGSSVSVRTPDARYKDALKAQGFRWSLGSWSKNVTSTQQAIETLRALDSSIADLVIEPGQEAILAKL